MTKIPCAKLIFDLDGTLADTSGDLAAAMNHILGQLGRPCLAAATVRQYVGQGARILLERGLAVTGGADGAPTLEALLPDFLDYYRANIAHHSRLFAGADDCLNWADQAGVPLGICTNKPQDLAEALLDALGVKHRFASIVGGDKLAVRKPDARHVYAVSDQLPGDGPAVLIGDTQTDVKAGRAANVPVGLVHFGFSPIPVTSLDADFYLNDLAEIPSYLAAHAHLT